MTSNSMTAARERKKTLMLIDEYIKSEDSEKMKSPDGDKFDDSQRDSVHSGDGDPFLSNVTPKKNNFFFKKMINPSSGQDYTNMLHDFSSNLYSCRWPSHTRSIIAHLTHNLGHSNLIYFPNLCARHGGAAFLIPYIISYVCVGIPLLYAEMILGQFSSLPPVEIFRRISPSFAGIAVAMFAVAFYRSLYFSAIISQLIYAGARTMTGIWSGMMPGSNCEDDEYNSEYCHVQGVEQTCNISYLSAENLRLCDNYWKALKNQRRLWMSPHTDYMVGAVFQPRFKFEELALPSISVMLILLSVWVFSAFSAFKGIRATSDIFSVLKILNIIVVIVNTIISFLLQKQSDGGLTYFLTTDLSHMSKLETWSSAISHVLFSLNLGDGTVHRLSSYNNFNENFIFNAIIISVCDVFFSLMSGVMFFSAIGTISASLYSDSDLLSQQRIRRTLYGGFTLTLTAFPEQVSLTATSGLWASLVSSAHYFNLAKSGLSNLVMYIELILICVMDALSRFVDWETGATHRKRLLIVVIVMIFGYMMSVVYAGPSGIYLTKLVDEYTGVALMIICLAEIIVITYAYGFRRFLANVETMIIGGDRDWKRSITSLGLFYYVITPFFLIVGIILKGVNTHQAIMFDFLFPATFTLYGWLLVILCSIMIPVTMIYYILRLRIGLATLHAYMEPTTLWGPARPADREKNIKNERVVRKM